MWPTSMMMLVIKPAQKAGKSPLPFSLIPTSASQMVSPFVWASQRAFLPESIKCFWTKDANGEQKPQKWSVKCTNKPASEQKGGSKQKARTKQSICVLSLPKCCVRFVLRCTLLPLECSLILLGSFIPLPAPSSHIMSQNRFICSPGQCSSSLVCLVFHTCFSCVILVNQVVK